MAILLCAVGVVGCSTATSMPRRGVPVVGATGEHVTASPPTLDLDIVVRPRLGKDPHFDLAVSVHGEDLPRRFVVQKTWAGEGAVLGRIGPVEAKCGAASIALEREDLETHVGWTLPARCRDVHLSYAVAAAPRGLQWGDEYDAIVTPRFASAIAETALLLPDVPDDTHARVQVFFDLGEMPGAEGVYSLGPTLRETTTRALRHAYFAVGDFVTITASAPPLELEARFAGAVGFDFGAAKRDLERLLRAEAAMFPKDQGDTLRMLIVGMPAAHGMSHGTSLTESAAIWIDGRQPWSAEDARLSAHEMFHLYNGQVVRRTGPDERTYWLSEGFTEHYTDELMLRSGVWSARDWFEALRARVRAYHTHRDVEIPNDKAELGWGGADAQLPYLRGSMVAAYVDWAMRERSKGDRSLDDFMRTLVRRARDGQPALDQGEIFRLLGDVVGEDALDTVKDVAIDGRRMELPRDAFGSCVEVVGTGPDTDLRVRSGVDLATCVRSGR